MSDTLLARIGDEVLNHIFLINQLGTDARPDEIIKFAISFVCLSNPAYQEMAFFKTAEGVVKYNPILVATLAERLQFERILDTSLPERAVDPSSASLPSSSLGRSLAKLTNTSEVGQSDPSFIKITRYRKQMLENIWKGLEENLLKKGIDSVNVEMPDDEGIVEKYDTWTLDIRDEINPKFDYLQTVIMIFSTNIFKYCEEHNISSVSIVLGTVDDYADRKVGWWYKAKGYCNP
jgi:hypothetical protein